MKPGDNSPKDGANQPDSMTIEDTEFMAGELSIVFGYAHLLQRRLRRPEGISEVELLRMLNSIGESSRVAAEYLQIRMAGTGLDSRDDSSSED